MHKKAKSKRKAQGAQEKTTILDYSHSLIWSCEPSLLESINNEKKMKSVDASPEEKIINKYRIKNVRAFECRMDPWV